MTGFEDFYFLKSNWDVCFCLFLIGLLSTSFVMGLVYHPSFSVDILHASAVDHLTDCLPMY